MAPPTKLTPEIHKRIVGWIRTGSFLYDACKASGVTRHVVRNWIIRGRAEEEHRARGGPPRLREQRYLDFLHDLDKAQGEAKANLVQRIDAASKTDWRAAAWMLERKYPREFGLQVHLEVRSQLDAAMAYLERRLEPELFERVMGLLADATADTSDGLPGLPAVCDSVAETTPGPAAAGAEAEPS